LEERERERRDSLNRLSAEPALKTECVEEEELQ
jgi:hypothetical protein